jgi:hypothetical protein
MWYILFVLAGLAMFGAVIDTWFFGRRKHRRKMLYSYGVLTVLLCFALVNFADLFGQYRYQRNRGLSEKQALDRI